MIGGAFTAVPRTLCGHYYSKHPAVHIMSVRFLLSGLCLLRCLEGEASFLTRLQTSRATATIVYVCERRSTRFHFNYFRRSFLWRRFRLVLQSGGHKSRAGPVAIDVRSLAKAIFGVYFWSHSIFMKGRETVDGAERGATC